MVCALPADRVDRALRDLRLPADRRAARARVQAARARRRRPPAPRERPRRPSPVVDAARTRRHPPRRARRRRRRPATGARPRRRRSRRPDAHADARRPAPESRCHADREPPPLPTPPPLPRRGGAPLGCHHGRHGPVGRLARRAAAGAAVAVIAARARRGARRVVLRVLGLARRARARGPACALVAGAVLRLPPLAGAGRRGAGRAAEPDHRAGRRALAGRAARRSRCSALWCGWLAARDERAAGPDARRCA